MSDFLENVSSTDPMFMQQVKEDCNTLTELRAKMLLAEETFKQAQKAYLDFATKELPQKFKEGGIDMLSMNDGTQIRIVTKTRASILKGKDDGQASKKSISQWLRDHGQEQLIKEQFIVPQNQAEKLRASGIIFQETMDINTNSLKALVIDMLGQNGSPAVINKDDLPEGLSFYQWDEAEVN